MEKKVVQHFIENYEQELSIYDRVEFFMYLTGEYNFNKILELKWSDLALSLDKKYPYQTKIDWSNIYINFVLDNQIIKGRYKKILELTTCRNSSSNVTAYNIQAQIIELLKSVKWYKKSISFYYESDSWLTRTKQMELGFTILKKDKSTLIELLKQRELIIKNANSLYIDLTKDRILNIASSDEKNNYVFNTENAIQMNEIERHYLISTYKNENETLEERQLRMQFLFSVLRFKFSKEKIKFSRNYLLDLSGLTY